MDDKSDIQQFGQDSETPVIFDHDATIGDGDSTVAMDVPGPPSDGSVAVNPTQAAVDDITSIEDTTERVRDESVTVPFQQYKNLVSRVHDLETKLARVDKVVENELVEPMKISGRYDSHDFWSLTDKPSVQLQISQLEQSAMGMTQSQRRFTQEITWLIRQLRLPETLPSQVRAQRNKRRHEKTVGDTAESKKDLLAARVA